MSNIFDEVKKLNFPLGEYAVIGSGVMEAHGLRQHKDIDIVVSSDLFAKLKKQGWKQKIFFRGFPFRRSLTKENVEVFSNFKYKKYRKSNEYVIGTADVIQGIPFIKLQELAEFKMQLGRPKDFQDIALIKDYLSNK